jgi:hypothetical protein
VIATELMPRLLVGYTELGGSKLKKGNGFLKPNFETLPKLRPPHFSALHTKSSYLIYLSLFLSDHHFAT